MSIRFFSKDRLCGRQHQVIWYSGLSEQIERFLGVQCIFVYKIFIRTKYWNFFQIRCLQAFKNLYNTTHTQRTDGRAVECTGLENRRRESVPEFESQSVRHSKHSPSQILRNHLNPRSFRILKYVLVLLCFFILFNCLILKWCPAWSFCILRWLYYALSFFR